MAIDRGRPALLLTLGDAGLGKSRLAEEVAEQARECHGALVLPGRCVPYGEANVWWPVASAVQAACGVERGDDQDVVAGKVRAAVTEALDGADGARARSTGSSTACSTSSGSRSSGASTPPVRAMR